MAPKFARSVLVTFFEYGTAKVLHIRSKKVGIMSRFVQLLVIAYVVGWVLVYKKGYQDFDNVEGAITSKLKGVYLTNLANGTLNGSRVWDVADYVKPAEENNAFFIMTNAIVTPSQVQSTCPENPSAGNCTRDEDCAGPSPVTGSGIRTGNCINSTKPGVKTCELYAWCPVEYGDPAGGKSTPLIEVQNFTVYIRNNVIFRKFNQRRRNIRDSGGEGYLSSCHYDPAHPEDLCPIFSIGYILNTSESDPEQRELMLAQGGMIEITVTWDCNFDRDPSQCLPQYQFLRLDSRDAQDYPGYNFRYAEYYREGSTDRRTLYKAYGLRFVIVVSGTAGKFNAVPLAMNIGSGLGLLGVVTVICDFIVLNVLQKRSFYRDKKFEDFHADDAYKPLDESGEHDGASYGAAVNSDP